MSGENFYLRQAHGGTTAGKRPNKITQEKPKRKLKKDWLAEIYESLGREVLGLDKCTIETLTSLLEAINEPRT